MEEKFNNQETLNEIKESKKPFPKFSDILSISSNPEDLFTLLYPIGHGGFGKVYKAVHNETNTIVAIKIVDFINIKNISQNENIKDLCFNYHTAQKETSLMKLGNKSKYIVDYYGSYFSRKTNTLWLILEYCSSGSSIDLMLAMKRTYTELEISTIIENVLQGLIFIHSMNLIHRDIKGANILLSEDGYAKLGDFGVGIQLLGGENFRSSKKGSPYWMSPQVVKNINYDMKTDIWSLGITCVELSNGEPPFSHLNPKNVMEKISLFPPTVDDVIKKNEHTSEFYDFVKKCLEIDPQKRPSAKELINHKFITRFSRGNKFLAELIFKHAEDIDKFRKIVNDKNKNNNKKNENYIKKDNNYTNEAIKNNINLLNEVIDEEYNLTLGKKNLIYEYEDSQKSLNNESNFTSHFHNEGKLNGIQEKELLINKISSSSNLENYATKGNELDTQKQLKNNTKNKKDSDKNNLKNNIGKDSFSENNNNNFTTFHNDEYENTSDEDGNDGSQEIHHEFASFDKNYLYFENKNINNKKYNNKNEKKGIYNNQYKNNDIRIRLIKKNNNFFHKPLLNEEKMNLLFSDNNSFEKNTSINKKIKNINYINDSHIQNKSTDNIFIYNKNQKWNKIEKINHNININSNHKFSNQKNTFIKHKSIINFVYTKPKIKNNSRNNLILKKSKSIYMYNKNKNNTNIKENNNKIINKKTIDNKGCISYGMNILEKMSIDSDEEGNINKTNLFRTKSNFAIFRENKVNNIMGNTNYFFYKNKTGINDNFIEKNDKNNLSDINEYIKEKKYHINNNTDIMNKTHIKYFRK